ncbi:hypothetical protein GDO78_011587 [Eleutherodactylus coqui]|uniref:Uncharacterized protein n=2 Tax=Eleutherodactylus coqui TaxID=57060 RepID=A0A8J6F1A4_ELECQ|nr:hypothetical protein GDO78_011587 [Eleutherodactylus coqui]
MIENVLYKEMNLNDMKKSQAKPGATRSFILRNRPVPDLPVSNNNTSYNFYPIEARTMDSHPGGTPICNIKKEQSGDENIPPISPYEETFFFRHSENTKEAPGDAFSFSSNGELSERMGANTSKQHISEESSEESIYSTLEDTNRPITISSTEDTQRRSFQDATLQNDDVNQQKAESPTQNQNSSKEEFSITPYACFYEPYDTLNKADWLDKLSPHR